MSSLNFIICSFPVFQSHFARTFVHRWPPWQIIHLNYVGKRDMSFLGHFNCLSDRRPAAAWGFHGLFWPFQLCVCPSLSFSLSDQNKLHFYRNNIKDFYNFYFIAHKFINVNDFFLKYLTWLNMHQNAYFMGKTSGQM